MITLDNLSKSFGSRVLFENVTMTFNDGCRYGLTGPNGCGKSTILKIMMGLEQATSGNVFLPKKVGFLKQNIESFSEFRVIDAVIMGNKKLWEALSERELLYTEEMTDEIGIRLGEIEEVIAEEDGYSSESEAEQLLSGMGIYGDMHYEKMGSIPLDRQFRVLLCQALFGKPKALLLDEPTNNLDLESISWLETFLKNYSGSLIVISHDRHFLNAITTHIADIDYETVILYPGNYDEMVVTKTSVRERSEADIKNKEKKIAQLREFVAKFGAGTRASQVQSRLKEIDRLQPQDLKKSNIQRPYIRFILPDAQSGKIAFKIENCYKSYDEKKIMQDFSCDILRGEKIAVIGNNGMGKSTLLKLLAQVISPDKGSVALGHMVKVGYFPQIHTDLVEKKKGTNLFDWLKTKKPDSYDQDIRGVLGKMLFGGDDAFKEVSALSGGETARLIISALMLTQPNTLILDEPNNHLDLEAVSALAWGLNEFKGTVVFASHDRDLISKVATKILAFDKEGLSLFLGNLDEYLARKK
ncbi:MAG: ABC-F family ATP-binding cassette domain-containing protein [Chlamydiae bacterium]|nr:ABC-F family ATP-binding cassette domain-containing protein [Chlamydiota bacterium]